MHNLKTSVYDRVARPLAGGGRYVPFNTVPGGVIFHIDDKSAAELPTSMVACVGDDRALLTVKVNGEYECVTDVQLNYLSLCGGSKDSDTLVDEIVCCLAERMQGEMTVVLLFDNCAVDKCGNISAHCGDCRIVGTTCAVGKCGKISAQLPEALKDRGFCTVVESLYFPKYHGKLRADSRFGGYEHIFKQKNGLDCLGRTIESLDSDDFARIVNPISQERASLSPRVTPQSQPRPHIHSHLRPHRSHPAHTSIHTPTHPSALTPPSPCPQSAARRHPSSRPAASQVRWERHQHREARR